MLVGGLRRSHILKLILINWLQEDSAFEGYDLTRVRTELGPHKRETLLKASQLVLSPGVPLMQTDIVAAIQAVSIVILNMTWSVLMRICPCKGACNMLN